MHLQVWSQTSLDVCIFHCKSTGYIHTSNDLTRSSTASYSSAIAVVHNITGRVVTPQRIIDIKDLDIFKATYLIGGAPWGTLQSHEENRGTVAGRSLNNSEL